MQTHFQKMFSSAFDATLQSEPCAAAVEYAYPGAVRGGWVEGVGIEIYPEVGEPWFASFAAGQLSPNAVTGAIDLPDHKSILAVSKGEGYVVDSSNPERWEHLKILPVMGFEPLADLGLVLLWDFTKFVALGDNGIAWKTPSVSWDGISDVVVDGRHARAKVWSAPTQSDRTVVIDLPTGEFQGGSSPELDVEQIKEQIKGDITDIEGDNQ